ncbi:HIT family protein [Natronomonas salina]|uniref:HIT family protein n=1 Tax=Natronomonas salina TaxID=1710540 RepID=UPI0015B52CBC|nr:HIT family protein [Natronomonas salina]QLD90492.1 HIT family protein [Natronomonas salina]
MSDDCIFCRIVDGEIPSRTVYEDDEVLAFLDANPLSPGHTLVVPKAHHQFLSDLPADLSASVFAAVRELTPRVQRAVDAEAHTIAVNDGPAAGQEVPHLHVHVVPRFEGDGGGPIHAITGDRPDLDDDELDDIADDIRG